MQRVIVNNFSVCPWQCSNGSSLNIHFYILHLKDGGGNAKGQGLNQIKLKQPQRINSK